jgi:hypothetical protein
MLVHSLVLALCLVLPAYLLGLKRVHLNRTLRVGPSSHVQLHEAEELVDYTDHKLEVKTMSKEEVDAMRKEITPDAWMNELNGLLQSATSRWGLFQ